jgi:hypothetical protein
MFPSSKFRAMARIVQAQGVSHSEIQCRLLSVYGLKVFNRREVSVATTLEMDERHRMMMRRNTEADQVPRALMQIMPL